MMTSQLTHGARAIVAPGSLHALVNVSSGLGSLTMLTDPKFRFADLNNAAYPSSKTALNALTVLYAKDLAKDGFKVNAVSPGYRATELNGGLPTPGAGKFYPW